MNRREFFKLTALTGASLLVGALVKTEPQTNPSWFVRPQKSVADLEAEYRAWMAGNLDDHDKTVLQVKNWLRAG